MRMTKKITSIVLAVLMVVSMVVVGAVSATAATRNVNTPTKFLNAVANAASGDTIKLTADIDLSKVTTNRNAHDTGHELKIDLKDFILDLNGKTITSVNASVVYTGNGAIIKNGNFALNHVKADGTTYQAGSYGLCIDGYGVANGITLTDLTVEGGINIWDADVDIYNVTATATASNFYAIWAEGNSNVVVNSGTFSDNGTSVARGPIATGTEGDELGALVTVKGGTFNATNKVVNNAAPDSVKFEGGTSTKSIPAQYCADGFAPKDNGDGTYGVKSDNNVAEVNGTQYATLQDAINAASSGDTVKLLADIDYSKVTTNRNAHDRDEELKVDLKDLTLDLDGHTITTVNASVVFTGNDATIKNGNFALNPINANGSYQAGSYGICIDGYGVANGITLNDLTVEGGVNVNNANVEINDVTATATSNNFYAIWAEGNSNVVVNSGVFSDNGAANARGLIATDTSGTEALVTVKGGTFNATNKVVNAAASDSVKIAGGTFTKPVLEEYCADGYLPENNGDGTYGVDGPFEAKIGDTGYATLRDALDVVPDGGTVTVLKDITTSGNIFADGYVSGGNRTYTVDLGGYTVSGGTFIVSDGNDVTFKNGTIESASYAIQNTATATVDSTATVKSTSASVSAVYSAAGSTTNINGTVEGDKYGVIARGGTLNVAGKVTATNTGIDAIDGGIANINDGADVSGKFAIVAHKDSTVNVNGGKVEGTSHAVSGNGKAADGPYTINVTGGTLTATNGAAIYNPNATGTMNISGGTITGSTTAVAAGESSTNNISGGTFNTPVPEEYCADTYVPVVNGNGTYGVEVDTNPLNPFMITAADAKTADDNKFGLTCDYLKGTLLGVQKKEDLDTAEKVPGSAITSASGQEGAKNIRFVAVIDTQLIRGLGPNDDYGFVLAKVSADKTYSDKIENIKYGMESAKTISAKDTFNNVCGTSDEALEYGDPSADTPYKYVTCAVNDIKDDSKIVARFYYKKGDKVYYAKYAGHNYQYTGCISTANAQ